MGPCIRSFTISPAKVDKSEEGVVGDALDAIIRVRGLLPEGTMVSLRASGRWGGRYKPVSFFLFFFLLLSGQVMVLVTSGLSSWDVPRGGPI